MPLLQETLHDRDLLRDVLGGAGHHIWFSHAECLHVGPEDALPTIGEGANLYPLIGRRANDLVIDIREVDHPAHRMSARAQPADEKVGEEEAPEVSNMRWAIDGRAARVDADLVWVERHKRTRGAREGVSQLQHGLPLRHLCTSLLGEQEHGATHRATRPLVADQVTCGGLHAHGAGREADERCDPLPHLWESVSESRAARGDRQFNPVRGEPCGRRALHHFAQQIATIHSARSCVGCGEEAAEIAEVRSAKECVRSCVKHYVAI